MTDWYPPAIRDPFRDGGSYTSGPPKGLLHTTEGSTYAGARSVYASRQVAPHFTVSFQTGRFQVWQHIPISRAARALRNQPGGAQTNRDHVIQIEIVGRAALADELPKPYLDGLRALMRWIEANAGVPRRSTVRWKPYPASYGANGVRLTGAAWDGYSGWCGHMHAPENAHGDPGLIDIGYLLQAPAPAPPPAPPTPPVPVPRCMEENMSKTFQIVKAGEPTPIGWLTENGYSGFDGVVFHSAVVVAARTAAAKGVVSGAAEGTFELERGDAVAFTAASSGMVVVHVTAGEALVELREFALPTR